MEDRPGWKGGGIYEKISLFEVSHIGWLAFSGNQCSSIVDNLPTAETPRKFVEEYGRINEISNRIRLKTVILKGKQARQFLALSFR
jgi:hypothetical protein